MRYFLVTLKLRNEPLFMFGCICFIVALLCILLSRYTPLRVSGVNAYFKPLKFALSIGIFAWTMGWFAYYLNAPKDIQVYNWVVISMLGFELLYILFQASRGQLSHYNNSHPFYAGLYVLMALAATVVTLWTAYLGMLFFHQDLTHLPDYYVWSIRIGIILFVIFSLVGFVMGSRMMHSVGGEDGGSGIPILNWNICYGDLRIAHFFGMHALQVLPILSFYFLKSVKATFFVGLLYLFISIVILYQALQGKSLFNSLNH